MKNKTNILVLTLIMFVLFIGEIISPNIRGRICAHAQDLSGGEIMKRVDDNQFIASGRIESEMIINDRGRQNLKSMIIYLKSDGEATNALVEFINPRDRGTKYLLQDDELWMYFPDAEELVRISGHMLQQRMMGSAFSYQDMLESEKLTKLYEFKKEEEKVINGRRAYVIDATARPEEEPAYRHRKFLIDVERFVILQDEMYAGSGRLLKVMSAEEVKEVQTGRWMTTKVKMEDKLRAEMETTYHLKKILLDYHIPTGKLSLESLQ